MVNAPHIFLTAGGTAGHVFPALALAELLSSKGYIPHLITDTRGACIQKPFVSLAIHRMPLSGMGQGGILRKALCFFGLGVGFLQSLFWILKFRPQAVIGFGGYPALAPMCAAVILGRQTLIHEQNAVLGRVNRWLAPCIQKIAVSFPHTHGLPKRQPGRVKLTGMPIRDAVGALRGVRYQPPESNGILRILVLGGSQGAKVFSDIIPAAIARLPLDFLGRLHIIQQCRWEDLKRVGEVYTSLKPYKTELSSFFEDVAQRLAATHLVIARSGASTCAELMISGRPALFIPFPRAMDDHQTMNACRIADMGAAWHLPQKELTEEGLAAMIADLFSAPAALLYASEAMRGLGEGAAAQKLAALIEAAL